MFQRVETSNLKTLCKMTLEKDESVQCFNNLPTIEFIGIFFSRIVKIQAKVGVDSNSKIVVHNKYLGVVLVGNGCRCWHDSPCSTATFTVLK